MLILLAVALMAGAAASLQVGVNIRLREWAGDPVAAAFVSFLVGTVTLAAYMLATRIPWPQIDGASRLPLWHWSGGVLGAFIVASTVIVAPRLGAATTLSLMVAGQMLTALALDHFALFGYPQHTASPLRMLGIALIVAGVIVIRRF
nr:DMT family transporter [Desulfobaculum xiamenense]